MERKILVLLEQIPVRREVVSYTIELARRMGARIHVLELADPSPSEHGVRPQREKRLKSTPPLEEFLQEVRRAGLDAVATLRSGDCVSELLKYLAECEPFQAVVWGGSKQVLRSPKGDLLRHHWLERVRSEIRCPLVIPSLRKDRRISKQGQR
jgi:hypothetical protein